MSNGLIMAQLARPPDDMKGMNLFEVNMNMAGHAPEHDWNQTLGAVTRGADRGYWEQIRVA